MSYEWDPDTEKSNYKKHRVKFADAVGVFEDENAITIADKHKRRPIYDHRQGFPQSNPGCGLHIS